MIERQHKPLADFLRTYVTIDEEWVDWLPLAAHAMNAAKSEATNYSAFELLFGYKARVPSQFPPRESVRLYDDYLAYATEKLQHLRALAGLTMITRKYRSRDYYNKKLNLIHFLIGEEVYLINNKIQPKHCKKKFIGPFEITDIDYERHNAEIQHGNYVKVVHLDLLKKAIDAIKPGNIIEKPETKN